MVIKTMGTRRRGVPSGNIPRHEIGWIRMDGPAERRRKKKKRVKKEREREKNTHTHKTTRPIWVEQKRRFAKADFSPVLKRIGFDSPIPKKSRGHPV